MEDTHRRLIKESLAEKRKNIQEWMEGSSIEERRTRVGPAGEHRIEQRLQSLDAALQKAEQRTLGLCTVCHEHVESSRLEMDYAACVCLDHLTGAERTRLENDLELSQKVQRALLPHDVPTVRGLEIAAFSQPAHIVSGDYFDFARMHDGALALVIADVMGKGMPASLLMASLQASLRIIAPESTEPAEIVSRLNAIFCNNIRLTKFVTLFIGRYDDRTGILTYCNAGHNPPLLSGRDGSIRRLLPTGAAIGLVERAEFTQTAVRLYHDDLLLLYTDGLVESWNADRELFGQDRLETHLRDCSSLPPQDVIRSLRARLRTFTGSHTQADDTTMIAARLTEHLP